MYLSKNTPALLLRKFITSYLTAPDKPILRKELLDSTEVVKDRKHPNLESRFKLLESALRKCNAPFTIRKVHRGCFCLIAYCRIDYTEK